MSRSLAVKQSKNVTAITFGLVGAIIVGLFTIGMVHRTATAGDHLTFVASPVSAYGVAR